MTRIAFNIKERIGLSKKLSYLLGGGMSIAESISLIGAEQKKRKAICFRNIEQDLFNGKSLHESFARQHSLFDRQCIHLIRIGEMTGSLSKSFKQIAEMLESRRALRNKIQAALIYPAIIIMVALILIVILLLYVFPHIVSVFGSMNASLPLSTRIFMASAVFLKKYGIILALTLTSLFLILIFAFRKSRGFRIVCEYLLFMFSPLRNCLQPFILAKYCAMFGLLLSSGMSFIETSLILEELSASVLYSRSCRQLRLHAEAGRKPSAFFKQHSFLFPTFLSSLINVGESTGNLSGTFAYMAVMYEQTADEILRQMTALVEPILMVFIGLFVGALALAIISPIYQLTSALSLK
jgi:type IV pilus assembly protein PilC